MAQQDKRLDRRERLHLAIGAYAEYLAGMASESEMQAAAASLSLAEPAGYDQITASAKARFRRNTP